MALTEIALLKWQTNESLVFEDCWFAVQLSRGTWGKSRSYLNPILPGIFGHSQPRGVFGTTPCNSFIWPSINLKLGTSIGMSKKYSQKIAELLLEMTCNDVISHFCNFFVSCPIFLKFCTEMLIGITNKNTKFCWDWLRNDVTITSSLILRTQFVRKYPSKNVLPWQYEALYSAKSLYRGTNYHFKA